MLSNCNKKYTYIITIRLRVRKNGSQIGVFRLPLRHHSHQEVHLFFRAFFTNSSLLKQERGLSKLSDTFTISHILPPGACQRAKEDAVEPNSPQMETKILLNLDIWNIGKGAPDVTVSVDIDWRADVFHTWGQHFIILLDAFILGFLWKEFLASFVSSRMVYVVNFGCHFHFEKAHRLCFLQYLPF